MKSKNAEKDPPSLQKENMKKKEKKEERKKSKRKDNRHRSLRGVNTNLTTSQNMVMKMLSDFC